MSRAGGASGRTACIVATMAVWLCLAPACGRLGYTPINAEIAGGAGGSGGAGGTVAEAGPGGDVAGGAGGAGSTGGGTGGAGSTGGAGGAGSSGGSSLDGNVMQDMGGSGGTGGTPGTGGSSSPPADAPVDRNPDLPPDGPPPASSVTLTGGTMTPRRGTPTVGATESMVNCPGDQVVIGFEGFHSRNQVYPWLASAGAICGTVTITGSTVTIAEAGKLPVIGSTSGTAWTRPCPQNQVVVGFEGTAAGWIGVLSFRCAPLIVSGTGALSPGSVTKLEQVGAPSGSAYPTTDCPPGQVARGQNITASTWIDGFGLFCATPERR